jgi:16S rRNA processing protein RimM
LQVREFSESRELITIAWLDFPCQLGKRHSCQLILEGHLSLISRPHKAMSTEDCYKIGYVSKTHGLKGEVTVNILPECPDLTTVETVYLGNDLVPHFIASISIRGDKAFIRFDDVDGIDQAAALKGLSLFLPKSDRPKLARGEFYNDEIVGFEVVEEENVLGKISDIMEAGPNRFLVMDHNDKEVLIPVNGPFIKSVNKSKKRVTVELPEGFLDL